MFTRRDLFFSVITGLYAGFVAWRIVIFLELAEFIGLSYVWLIVFIPILWILGVNLGYFLGRWVGFFNQFGKFAAIGFTNATVYFGMLNLLIFWSEINKGIWYSAFVTVAFILGATHSYFWNKFWVFRATEEKVSSAEFGKFMAISIVAGIINVGIASGVVNLIESSFGFTADQWANIGGVAGSAVALVFSFVGFKLAVFRK